MVQRIQEMTLLYACCLLSDKSEASHLYTMLAVALWQKIKEEQKTHALSPELVHSSFLFGTRG